ncbi:FG-GAP repeat protein [Roseateles sp.]|uniref:FG-GAP repeat protein n=1 Tax=Roseateles sp. TaxID=1971397 RepID=UPI003D149393
MRNHLPLSIALLLACSCAAPVAANERPEALQAFASQARELRHLDFVWGEATGDLNGDGISDVALVLTGSRRDEAPREERLVVLAGVPSGGYRILSLSGEFCHPGKFYTLDIKRGSLIVEAVETSDASRHGSTTRRFRYNAKLKDLELIGEDTLSVAYDEDEEERSSANYLTGKSIATLRSKGKTRSSEKRIESPVRPVRLNGWDCGA